MVGQALTREQKRGIRLVIVVNLLVPVVFLTVLLTGRPIMLFATTATGTLYSVLVCVPVIVLCIIALRRLRS